MSVNENKALIRRYLDAMSGNAKTETLLSEYIADPDLRRHIGAFEAAFPRYQLQVEDMFGEDDKVVVRATFRGRHQGELRGVPPTGKDVTYPVIIIYHLADGKIQRHWLVADTLSLAQQIGAAPQPAESVR